MIVRDGSRQLVLLVGTQPAVLRHNHLHLVSSNITAVKTFLSHQICIFIMGYSSGLDCITTSAGRDCRVKSTPRKGRQGNHNLVEDLNYSFSIHQERFSWLYKSPKRLCNWSKLFTLTMFYPRIGASVSQSKAFQRLDDAPLVRWQTLT